MAKAKSSNGSGNVPNKALHSRVSYLYQAATYLATHQQHSEAAEEHAKSTNQETSEASLAMGTNGSNAPFQPVSRRLISDLRSVSLKVQMRMSPAMKHSICKNCDTMLINGTTCSSEVENKSAGGKKPWADVLVRRCNTCGAVRRFPLAAQRQKRRPNRLSAKHG
jgi:ribonuclease P protein subunit RPR2